MLNIQTKPWIDREDGRIVVYKGQKVVFSKHYRDLKHRDQIIEEVKEVIKCK